MDVSEEDAAKVMQRLCQERYVDDLRYARAFARDKSTISGWGATKISYMLRSKGVDALTIAEAIGDTDPEQSQKKLRTIVLNKWKSLKDEDVRVKTNKVLRFALGRGYGYDEAMRVIETVKADDRAGFQND